jgi:hypothetical protein
MTTIEALRKRLTRLMRSAIFAAAGATFIGISACGSDGPTSPNSGGKVTGTWVLESIDDEEPPVAIHRGAFLDPNTGAFYNNYVFRLTAGYIEIRENETFYLAINVRIEADGQTAEGTMELEGEWDLVEDEVVLRVQFPFVGTEVLERRDGQLHADIDFLGLGETAHLDFSK